MCCALPSCVEGLAEPGLPEEGNRGDKVDIFFWLMVFLLPVWACLLWEHAWIEHLWSVPIPPCVAPPWGPARWAGETLPSQRWVVGRRDQPTSMRGKSLAGLLTSPQESWEGEMERSGPTFPIVLPLDAKDTTKCNPNHSMKRTGRETSTCSNGALEIHPEAPLLHPTKLLYDIDDRSLTAWTQVRENTAPTASDAAWLAKSSNQGAGFLPKQARKTKKQGGVHEPSD